MTADWRTGLFPAFVPLILLLLSACTFNSTDSGVPPAPVISIRSDGFTNFETEPVRPLALSADGRYLYALSTADDRLEIFDAQGEILCPPVSDRDAKARSQRHAAFGPNDGLSLLSDLIVPGGVTLAELGRDHFLLDDRVDVTTVALALAVIQTLEERHGK